MTDTQLIRIEGLPRPVAFVGDSDLVSEVFRGWRHLIVLTTTIEPMLTVYCDAEGFRIEGHGFEPAQQHPGHVDGLRGFIARLVRDPAELDSPLFNESAVPAAGR